ncbi:Ig-like domain-containing protein, partial [Pantoea sp.]|uniref:Ig-like domain-containing protein n=1 Tax=Pantoea sp. TaxID=69393 RepID=UPI0031E056B6
MSAVPVNAAVVDKNTIVKAEVLTTGKAVKIKAIPGGKYILSEGEHGVAPENITLKRVGKNLHVILEGSDLEHPELIITDFYTHPGQLVGKGEDGQWHEYIATSGEERDDAAFLMDGDTSGVALGAASITGLDGLTVAGFALSPALLALGALAALAAATGLGYLIGRNKNDNDGNNSKSGSGEGGGLDLPAINGATDDFGSRTGPLVSGDVTDDSTPTFHGTGKPGSTIEMWDNGKKVGETQVDADGNWSLTPELEHGQHTIVVVERDPSGKTGEPSPGFELNVDLEAPNRAQLREVWDDVAPRTGAIENNGSTNDQQPEFRGSAEAGATVEIILNGEKVAEVPVDADGNWSWTPGAPLPEGNHSVELIVVDPAGNPSLPTPPFNFEVDTTPPVMVPGAFDLENVIDDVGMKTGKIDSGDITDDARPTFNGGGLEPGDTVELHDAATGELVGSTTVRPDGSWSFTPDVDLSEGDHSISIIVVDAAGNASAPSPSFDFTVDTTPPPKPTGDQFEGAWDDVGEITGQIGHETTTDDSRPEFKGTGLTPGHIVHIREEFFGEMGSTVVDADGNWSWTPAVDRPLSNGDYSFEIVIEDEVGRVSEPSDRLDFTVDLTPPGQVVITELWDDQGAVVGPINGAVPTDDAQPEIRGTAEANSKVWVYIDGVLEGTTTADDSGNWTFTPDRQLSNGSHRVTAQASDAAGNRGAVSLPFDFTIIAGGAADSPAITGVIDNVAGGIVGNIAPEGLTNDPRPEVQGTAPAGTVVDVKIDGISIGTVTADANGRWSIVSDRDLASGRHVIVAEATDGSTPPSGEYAIIVDVDAPNAAEDLELIDDVPLIVGEIVSGDTTDDRTPTFNGTAEVGSTVIIRDNGTPIGSVRVESSDGSWSWTAPPLADGDYSFDVIVEDEAGNQSAPSPAIDFTVDTSAVLISIDGAVDNVGAIQGPLSNGSVTDDATPTLHGQATANSLVTIYRDGGAIGSVMANGRGEWSLTVNLPEGEHRLTATVTTAAGGESVPTGEFVLIVDLTPPARPVIDAILDDVGAIQGPLNNPGITDDSTPTLVGSGVEAHALVIIYEGNNRIGSVQADADGNWRWTPNPGLNDGCWQFSVAVQDKAGWVSDRSEPWVIDIDTVAPTRPVTGPGGALEGAWDDVPSHIGLIDDLTNDNRPTFAGGGLTPGDTVEIWDETGSTKEVIGTAIVDADGNWNFTPEAGNEMADGDHIVTIVIVEPTGQRSPESDPLEFEIDTAPPPAPVITAITEADGTPVTGDTEDARPTLTGTSERNAIITIHDTDGTVLGSTQADASGNWSFRPALPLTPGPHELTATAQDPAGNTSVPSLPADLNLVGGGITPDVAITGVHDDVVANIGPVEKGGLTNDPTPTVNGTGLPGTIVHLFDGTRELGSATVDTNGRWSITPAPLASGDYVFIARPALPGGGFGAATGDWPVTIDIDPPSDATDLVLWDDENNAPIIVAPGGTTDDPTPTLEGRAEEGATVIVRDQDGNLIGSTIADEDGNWRVTPTTPLEDGDYRLEVEVIDEAGNSNGGQPGPEFTLDTSGRVVSITHVADDEGSITGNVASGGRTDDTTPTLHGRATANSIVTIYVDGVAAGSAQTNAFGYWELALALSEGTYAMTASVTTPAGVVVTTSPFELTVDTTGPAQAVIDRVIDDVGADQGNLNNPDKTDDATPTLEGRGNAGETVNVYVDNVLIATVQVRGDGSWSYTLPPQADGTYDIEVSLTDDVGNEGPRSEVWELTIDTVPPVGSITGVDNDIDPANLLPVTNGGWTNDTTPVVRGEGEPGTEVRLYDQAGNLLGTATVAADRSWSITVSPALAQGEQTLTATFDDGVHQTQSNPWVVNIDTVAPAVGTITEIWDNVGTTGAVGRGEVTDDNTPTVRGSGEALSWVYIYDGLTGTTVLGSTQVRADGTWEVELNPLADGIYNFTAHFVDLAGNPSAGRAESWQIEIIQSPPPRPITGPGGGLEGAWDDVPSHIGIIEDLTNDNRPTFAGGGLTPGNTVEIWDDFGGSKELIGTAIVDADGNWNFTPEVGEEMADGDHVITIIEEGRSGLRSPESDPLEFEIDTAPPPAPVIIAITDANGTPVTGDTQDPRPTLTGTSERNAIITIHDTDGTVLGSTQADASGNWSFRPALPLTPGPHELTATAQDPAGNTSVPSLPADLNLVGGGITPDVAITGVHDDVVANIGPVEKGGLTNDPTPTVNGTGLPGTIVHLFDGTRELGSATVDTNGRWSITPAPLASGDYVFIARPALPGGGFGAATGDWPVTIDIDPPADATDLVLWDDENNAPIVIAPGGTTDDPTPTLEGRAEEGATVIVRDQDGNLIGSTIADEDGNWRVTPTTPLEDGDYRLEVEVIDEAGNSNGGQPGP